MTNVVLWVLALNFLAAAGGVGYLVAAKKLDREKVLAIRQVIAGPKPEPAMQPATQPTAQILPDETPITRLEAVLAQAAGRPAVEQSQIVQTAFDTQSAMLERRQREIEDQQRQLPKARDEFDAARKNFLQEQTQLTASKEEQARLAEDKGFQDTLALYQSMPPKKTKTLLMLMSDEVVVRYLQSMEPRQAGSILKEFKTPEEVTRAQAILEKMSRAQAEAK
jgi:flagellar motility protein MotE (MotC chaperone)